MVSPLIYMLLLFLFISKWFEILDNSRNVDILIRVDESLAIESTSGRVFPQMAICFKLSFLFVI